MFRTFVSAVGVLLLQAPMALAQTSCQFYAQNPDTITVTDTQNIEREVEIDFLNTGTSTWQNTGGVSNLAYIELRPVGGSGVPIDGPLYHLNWINRQRVASFLTSQQGVAPNQVARFVFKVQVNGATLGIGTHDCYFRPYHAQGGYIYDWGTTKIRVVVTASSSTPAPAPTPSPTPTPAPAPSPTPNPTPTTLVAQIQSVQVERTVLNGSNGAYVEQYDLVRSGAVPLRRYQTLQLAGTVSNGTPMIHEWSVSQNGISRSVGNAASCTTKPDDLFIGNQQLRYRVQDAYGSWTTYATFALEVGAWPKVYVPVHGSFRRNGYNYNEGDHRGSELWGQDWNEASGGNNDFGLELVASLSGTATIGISAASGRYVNIEHTDSNGNRYRCHYVHLSSVLVRDGEAVSQGQPIGLCGNTGSASQGTHLHYVFSQWVNGAWASTAPEPCFIDSQTVRQTIAYDQVVNANTRALPQGRVILPESAVSAPYRDELGYGHTKAWSSTTNAMQPTSYANWDTIVPLSGIWKLWMHNPSGVTNDNNGLTSHNTTASAVFEINRPRVLGLETHRVNQSAGIKGALIEVCEMDLQAGDRLLIRQHNATGEVGREISFDELVLTLEVPAGSGGSNPSMPPTNPPPSTQPYVPTSPSNPNQPTPALSPSQPGNLGSSRSGGGGGCAIATSTVTNNSPLSYLPILFFLIIFSYGRRYCSSAQ